uniref:Replication protein A3 n=1 Tax=Pelodiscus sinensis TaxID=13735 RepID=K7FA43_PELSI
IIQFTYMRRQSISCSSESSYNSEEICFDSLKIHPSGKLFILSDGEGKNTTVELTEPLDEELSGVIEVVGRVTNQATIMCMSYVQFREDKSAFDLVLYNEALKIIHEFPEYIPFGVTKND